jgi:cytochrome P450
MTDSIPASVISEQSLRYLTDAAAKRQPYEFLAELRATEPVHHSPNGMWLITDYDLALQALRHPGMSRELFTGPEVEFMFEPSRVRDVWALKMVNRDGPDHIRLRKLLTSTFSPQAVQAWHPEIVRTVGRVFDDVAQQGQAEFVHDIAYPIPEHVVCALLDVPFVDSKLFEQWSAAVTVRPQGKPLSDEQRRNGTVAMQEWVAYLTDVIARRRRNPGDDLVSMLLAIEDGGEQLSENELIAVLIEVIDGGHDTTANSITNGVLMLLTHPDQFARLKADRGLIPTAIEEIMRYRSPVQITLSRMTGEDVTLGGATIPAGSGVVICLAAANRNEEQFADPDVFDVGRRQNRHLGFGMGRHVCLGQHLARIEMQVTLERILDKMPGLRLTEPLESLPWRNTTHIISPSRLPVAW